MSRSADVTLSAELKLSDEIKDGGWCYEITDIDGEGLIAVRKRPYGPEVALGMAREIIKRLKS